MWRIGCWKIDHPSALVAAARPVLLTLLPTAAIGDSLDWKELSAPEITKRVLDRVKPGSIILFHNAALHTPEALPGIIESLQADGYSLLPVSELIYQGEFTLDHEGRQIPADTQPSAQPE